MEPNLKKLLQALSTGLKKNDSTDIKNAQTTLANLKNNNSTALPLDWWDNQFLDFTDDEGYSLLAAAILGNNVEFINFLLNK